MFLKTVKFSLIFLLILPKLAYPYTVKDTIVNVTQDAIIRSSSPYTNYGDSDYILATCTPLLRISSIQRSLVNIDLSNIPSNAIILSASLNLKGATHSGIGLSLLTMRVTETWDENTVTWNNQPSTTVSGYITNPSPDDPNADCEIDITAFAKGWHTGQYTNYGLMLRLYFEYPTKQLQYYSSDYSNATKHPTITIKYVIPETINIMPIEDIVVASLYPDSVFLSTKQYIDLIAWTEGGQVNIRRSLMKFNLDTLPEDVSLLSSKLHTFWNGFSWAIHSGDNKSHIYPINTSWSQDTIKWNNQPTYITTPNAIIPATTSSTQTNFEFDIFEIINSWYLGDNENNGIIMKLDTESIYRKICFASKEHTDVSKRPFLTLGYIPKLLVDYNYSLPQYDEATDIEVEPIGGISPYSYYWSHLDSVVTDSTIEIFSGTYKLTVVDFFDSTFVKDVNVFQHVNWNILDSIQFSNGELTTLISSNNWGARALAKHSIEINDDGLIKHVLDTSAIQSSGKYIVGFQKTKQLPNYFSINYGFLVSKDNVQVIENGNLFSSVSYNQNDVIYIERKDGHINYYQNDSLIYTSFSDFQNKLHIVLASNSPSCSISDIYTTGRYDIAQSIRFIANDYLNGEFKIDFYSPENMSFLWDDNSTDSYCFIDKGIRNLVLSDSLSRVINYSLRWGNVLFLSDAIHFMNDSTFGLYESNFILSENEVDTELSLLAYPVLSVDKPDVEQYKYLGLCPNGSETFAAGFKFGNDSIFTIANLVETYIGSYNSISFIQMQCVEDSVKLYMDNTLLGTYALTPEQEYHYGVFSTDHVRFTDLFTTNCSSKIEVDYNLTPTSDDNYQLDVLTFGGVYPFNYLWENSSTAISRSSISQGYYSLTVSDIIGNIANSDYFICDTVQFYNIENANVSENGVVSVPSSDDWSCKALSFNKLTRGENGLVEWKIQNDFYNQSENTEVFVGLCDGDFNTYADLSHAFYYDSGQLSIYEHGDFKTQVGSASLSDVYAIKIKGNNVHYLKNDSLCYSSTLGDQNNHRLGVNIKTEIHFIEDLYVSFSDDGLEPVYLRPISFNNNRLSIRAYNENDTTLSQIMWSNGMNGIDNDLMLSKLYSYQIKDSLNRKTDDKTIVSELNWDVLDYLNQNDSAIIATVGNWNAFAYSEKSVMNEVTGFVAYPISDLDYLANNSGSRIFGFSDEQNTSYNSIEHGFLLYNQKYSIYESGVQKTAEQTIVPGDLLSIQKVEDSIFYTLNGTIVYSTLAIENAQYPVVRLEDASSSFGNLLSDLRTPLKIVASKFAEDSISLDVSGGVKPYQFTLDNETVNTSLFADFDNSNHLFQVVDYFGDTASYNFTSLSIPYWHLTQDMIMGDGYFVRNDSTVAKGQSYSYNLLKFENDGAIIKPTNDISANTRSFGLTNSNDSDSIPDFKVSYENGLVRYYENNSLTKTISFQNIGTDSYLTMKKVEDDLIVSLNDSVLLSRSNVITSDLISIIEVNELGDTAYFPYCTFSPLPLTCTVDATTPGETGNVSISNIINGVPPYHIEWQNGDTVDYLNNVSPGVYPFTITDASGYELDTIATFVNYCAFILFGDCSYKGNGVIKDQSFSVNDYAISSSYIPANNSAVFEIEEMDGEYTLHSKIFGFSEKQTDPQIQDYCFGVHVDRGNLYFIANGQKIPATQKFEKGDIIKLYALDNRFVIRLNDEAIFEQNRNPEKDVFFVTHLYESFGLLSPVLSSTVNNNQAIKHASPRFTGKSLVIEPTCANIIDSGNKFATINASNEITWQKNNGEVLRTLLNYNVDLLPKDVEIASARLLLSPTGSSFGVNNSVIVACSDDWHTDSVNWDNVPKTNKDYLIDIAQTDSVNEAYAIDVSKLVKAWYSNEIQNHGALCRLADEYIDGGMSFSGGDSVVYNSQPRLEIFYYEPLKLETQSIKLKDTYAFSAKPTNIHGDNKELVLNGGDIARVYIHLPIEDIPFNANIDSASLVLHVGNYTTPNASSAYLVKDNWSEDSLTWNNQPDYYAKYSNIALGTISTNDSIVIDIAKLIPLWKSGIVENNGIMIKLDDEANGENVVFMSSESNDSTKHPKMHLQYSIEPLDLYVKDLTGENDSLASVRLIATGGVPPYEMTVNSLKNGADASFYNEEFSNKNIRIADAWGNVLNRNINLQQHQDLDLSSSTPNSGWNWYQSSVFNKDEVNGTLVTSKVGESRIYFDSFGRTHQAQSRSFEDDNILCQQVIYDKRGRNSIQSLPAPVNDNSFDYRNNFMTSNGAAFDEETPNLSPEQRKVDNNSLLGAYYSNNNSDELYVPATDYPYYQVKYNEILGSIPDKTSMAGDNLYMGSGNENKSYPMFIRSNELFHITGAQGFLINENYHVFEEELDVENPVNFLYEKGMMKVLSEDADGKQFVSYAIGGKKVASAKVAQGEKAGNYQRTVFSRMAPFQSYIDIHISEGVVDDGISIQANFETDMKIYSVSSGELVWATENTNEYFYSINDNQIEDVVINGEDCELSIQQSDSPVDLLIEAPSGCDLYRAIQISGLPEGVYRIYRSNPYYLSQIINIEYMIDYYNYNLSYYDKTGKLSKTIYPEGVQTLPEENGFTTTIHSSSAIIQSIEPDADPEDDESIPFVPHFTSANQDENGAYQNIISIPVEHDENSLDYGKISVRMYKTDQIIVVDDLAQHFACVAETNDGLILRNIAMAGNVNSSKSVENISPYVFGSLFLINDTCLKPVVDIDGYVYSLDSSTNYGAWHSNNALISGLQEVDFNTPVVYADQYSNISDLEIIDLNTINYNQNFALNTSNAMTVLRNGVSSDKYTEVITLRPGEEIILDWDDDFVDHELPPLPTVSNNVKLDFVVYGVVESSGGGTSRFVIDDEFTYTMYVRGDNTLVTDGFYFDFNAPDVVHRGELEIPADVYENIVEIQLELKEIHCNQSNVPPSGLATDAVYCTDYYIGNYSTGDLSLPYNDFVGSQDYDYYQFGGLDDYEIDVRLEYNQLQNAPEHTMFDTYSYNNWGQLLSNTTVDVGETNYLYRKDGKTRFIQNAKQADDNTFSYINYDDLGRIMETGEYNEDATNNFANLNSILENVILNNDFSTDPLNNANCEDQIYFRYDTRDQTSTFESETGLSASNYPVSFTGGRLSKTWTDKLSKWFSYDDFGRLSWMVVHYNGMGQSTIEGTKTYHMDYDLLGNLKCMTYQKNNENERFDYMYSYNANMQLVSVTIKTNYVSGTPNLVQEVASYQYYPDGKLKRTVIEEDLQGIDYVYTINGWLKSINNPNLGMEYAGKLTDPGQDDIIDNGISQDVFGMTLDYFDGDYKREANTAGIGASYINSGEGQNNYSGLIRSQRWNTAGGPQNNQLANERTHWMFQYSYDEFNRFIEAEFGQYTTNMQTNGTNGQSPHNLVDDVLRQISDIQATPSVNNGNVYSGLLTQIADAGKDLNYFNNHTSQSGNTTTNFENSENFTYFNANAAIVQSMVETGHDISLPQSQASLTYGYTSDVEEKYHVYDIAYSANGNITQLKRNGNLSGSDVFMDDLSYYYLSNSNQLDYVSDAVPTVRYDYDIDNQSSGNFVYDSIGSMIEDAVDGLYHVKDSRGKTMELRDAQSNTLLTEYTYDESGRCICIYDVDAKQATWFVRGPGGEIISVFSELEGQISKHEEQYLYGLGRIGKASTDENHTDIALLQYEYQDNLGNVRAVFHNNAGEPELLAINDYYPFGMKMPDRCVSTGNYGHAYQGVFAQEDAQYSQYNRFQLRTYDNRLGRFLSPDPYGQFYSAYTGMGNNPVNLVDPSGGYIVHFTYTSEGIEINDWYEILNWRQEWESPFVFGPTGGGGNSGSTGPGSGSGDGSGVSNPDGSLSGPSTDEGGEDYEPEVVMPGEPDAYETALINALIKDPTNQELMKEYVAAAGDDNGNSGGVDGLDNILFVVDIGKQGGDKAVQYFQMSNEDILRIAVNNDIPTERIKNIMRSTGKVGTCLKVVGVIGNVASAGHTVYKISQDGMSVQYGADLVFNIIAFVPPYGWVVSGIYFGGKALVESDGYKANQQEYRKKYPITGAPPYMIGHCFVEGTQVLMKDFSLCDIENIGVGDTIKTFNFRISQLENNRVLKISSPIHNNLVTIRFANDIKNINTEDHPYYV
jgi:RHS repeat-associated protein